MWNSILCKIQFVNMPYSWIRSFEKNFVDNTFCEKYFVEIIIGESWNINKSFGRNYNFENQNYDRLWNESYDKKRILDKTKSKNSQIVENLCVENFWVGTWTVETKGKKGIFVETPN